MRVFKLTVFCYVILSTDHWIDSEYCTGRQTGGIYISLYRIITKRVIFQKILGERELHWITCKYVGLVGPIVGGRTRGRSATTGMRINELMMKTKCNGSDRLMNSWIQTQVNWISRRRRRRTRTYNELVYGIWCTYVTRWHATFTIIYTHLLLWYIIILYS